MSTNRRGFFSWIAGLFAAGAVNEPEILRFKSVWAKTRILKGLEIPFCGVDETPWLICKVLVYCNGKKVERCIRANVIEGWCDVYETDQQGLLVVNESRTEIVRKRIYGTVRIERTA